MTTADFIVFDVLDGFDVDGFEDGFVALSSLIFREVNESVRLF